MSKIHKILSGGRDHGGKVVALWLAVNGARRPRPWVRLSVIVPVHNVEEQLPACLESILIDAGDDVEVVAVNDCSPDRSGSILEEYRARDLRVRLLNLTTNLGLSGARNAGLERAVGDYVWFVDSDDWLAPGSVPAVLDRLAATRPDVLVINHAEVSDDGLRTYTPPSAVGPHLSTPVRLAQQPRLLRMAQSACTKVVRRGFLEETGLRFAPGWYEDTSFSHSLLMAAESIDTLNRVCYYYRRRQSGGITTTVSDRHFEVFDQYQRLFEFVAKVSPEYDRFVPELFQIMVNHYLVILGNPSRLPSGRQRAFFRRMVTDYRDRLPSQGYDPPGGLAGLKHLLVRHDLYHVYVALRWLHRLTRLVRRDGRFDPGEVPGRRGWRA